MFSTVVRSVFLHETPVFVEDFWTFSPPGNFTSEKHTVRILERTLKRARALFEFSLRIPGGGFKYFAFSPLFGEDFQFD